MKVKGQWGKCLAIKNIIEIYAGGVGGRKYVPLAEELKANVETQNHQSEAASPLSNWYDFIYMNLTWTSYHAEML